MSGYTIRLTGAAQREYARRLILAAPDYAVVTIRAGDRTLDQNSLMWVLLSDISRCKPEGRAMPPEWWKAAFMAAMGCEIVWQQGIDGTPPFPAGFKTSRLSKPQMAELITMIMEYGDRHGVAWSEPPQRDKGENNDR